MKSRFLAFLIMSLASETQAATLINNVAIFPYSDFNFPSGSFAISYHGFPEAVFTPISSSTYLFTAYAIAEEFAFYNVGLGDLIDLSYTQQASRLISNAGNPFSANFDLAIDQSKYLGYWAAMGFLNSPNPANDYFGWVRVTRTAAGLVASESATSVGKGIYVGSFEEIPEPSASVLVLSAMVPLLRRKRPVTLTF